MDLRHKVVARLGEQHVTLRSLLSAARGYGGDFWDSYPGFEPAVLIVSGCVKPGGKFWPTDKVDQMTADMIEALDGVSPPGFVFSLVDGCYGWFPVQAIQPDIGEAS